MQLSFSKLFVRLFTLTLVFFFSFPISIYAQPSQPSPKVIPVTVTGKAVMTDNMTLSETKMLALNHARALAVEQAGGISTQRVTLVKNSLFAADFIKAFSHGFLIEETITEWNGSWLNRDDYGLGIPVVEITLRAKVKLRPEQFYKPNVLTAQLNRSAYTAGDKALLDISTKADTYLLIANYTSKGTMVPLYPNFSDSSNFITSGQQVSFPSRSAAPFIVSNYPENNHDTEAFIVIGLSQNNVTREFAWLDVFPPGKEMPYAEYYRRLVDIPLDWMAEEILIYTVSRS